MNSNKIYFLNLQSSIIGSDSLGHMVSIKQ